MYIKCRTNWILNTPKQNKACRFVWFPGRRWSIPVCGPQSELQADLPRWFEAWLGDHQKMGGAAACLRRDLGRPLGQGPWIPAKIWGTWAGPGGRCRGAPWWGRWWGQVECSSQGPGGAEEGWQTLCLDWLMIRALPGLLLAAPIREPTFFFVAALLRAGGSFQPFWGPTTT